MGAESGKEPKDSKLNDIQRASFKKNKVKWSGVRTAYIDILDTIDKLKIKYDLK